MIKCSPYSQLTFAEICYNDPLNGNDKTIGSGVLDAMATTTESACCGNDNRKRFLANSLSALNSLPNILGAVMSITFLVPVSTLSPA